MHLNRASGFGVSAIIYYGLNRLWPSAGSWKPFDEIDESEWHPTIERRRPREEDESSDKKQDDGAYVREVPVA